MYSEFCKGNNMRKIQIILLSLIVIGLGLLTTQKYWTEPFANFVLQNNGEGVYIPTNDPLNITFTISGKNYTLVDGKYEKEIASSTSKEIIMVFGQPIYGDFNNDGLFDVAMLITQNSGGSGTFFYVVEAIDNNGTFKGTNAMLLGDRIAPQNINVIDGRAVVNFAERKPAEPFTTPPSIGKSVYVQYDKNTGEIGEWVKDFEGESDLPK
ncbi:MAG: hypothetical protein AAB446_03180 [Patescibacteria group bacterium]